MLQMAPIFSQLKFFEKFWTIVQSETVFNTVLREIDRKGFKKNQFARKSYSYI